MWIARDKDGWLYLFENRPTKYENVWNEHDGRKMYLQANLFPEVKWEDEEPTEVELVIKKKV